MVQKRELTNGHAGAAAKERTPLDRAVLGFRNYWYPGCFSKNVMERKPTAVTLLGDEVVFLRRNGKAYALADECPHRGTRLSRGKYEFPGTDTISCRYHGWTYDVTNGNCVAALTDGPDSPVVGKVRVRTYPVEERKGIVWIWMGKMAPVPLEEDVPPLVLKDDTLIKTHRRVVYGNWRWFLENAPGHVAMVHRDSILLLSHQLPAYQTDNYWEIKEEGEDGEWLLYGSRGAKHVADYPGLGRWPRWRPWRGQGFGGASMNKDGTPKRVRDVPYRGMRTARRLPGITRIAHLPTVGVMYYGWFVPVDEDHYLYTQVHCLWFKHVWDRLFFYATYPLYMYRRWAEFMRLNQQDIDMVADSTDFAKRHGGNWPSPLYRPDMGNFAWRDYANTRARGEAVEPAKAKTVDSEKATKVKEPAGARGS